MFTDAKIEEAIVHQVLVSSFGQFIILISCSGMRLLLDPRLNLFAVTIIGKVFFEANLRSLFSSPLKKSVKFSLAF